MIKLLRLFFALFFNETGAASYYGVNRTLYNNAPRERTNPGEVNANIKCVHEEYDIDHIWAINEEMDGPEIPEGALIVDAILMVSGSTGGGGIFDLGLRAYTDIDGDTVAEDQDNLIYNADAGGQAVYQRASLTNSKFGKNLSKVGKGGAQTFVTCTEATTTTDVTERKLEYYVFYLLP